VSAEATLDLVAPGPHLHSGFSKLPTMPQTSFACLSTANPAATIKIIIEYFSAVVLEVLAEQVRRSICSTEQMSF